MYYWINSAFNTRTYTFDSKPFNFLDMYVENKHYS